MMPLMIMIMMMMIAMMIKGVVMMMVTRVTCADIVTTSVLYLQRMFLEISLSFERMYLNTPF